MKKIVLSIACLFGSLLTNAQTGAALNFDGVNDYVNIGTVIPLNSSYTKEAWVYANASGSNNIISSSSSPFWLMGGKLSAMHNGGSVFQDPGTFPLNQWVHVAVTYNSSTSLLSLFKNGILVNSGMTTTGYPADAIAIGQYGPSGANFFQGSIDEGRIWNVARTQCEINTFMNCEIPSMSTGLLANYHFNQGIDGFNNSTITTLVDASGNSNTFALSNFALMGTTSNWVALGGVVSGYTTSLVPPTITVNSGSICSGSSYTITPTGASTYTFSSGSAVVSPTANATYSITGTSSVGCVSSNTAMASITLFVSNQSVTASSSSICAGTSAVINVGSTETGIDYILRDNSNNAIIAGPTAGTGSLVAFNTGTISTTTTYNVFAIKPNGASGALNFNGTGEVTISGLNVSPSVMPVFTAEAWINLTNSNGLQTVIGNDNGGYDRGMVIWNGTYHIFAGTDINTGIVPNINVWEHVAITWSASNIVMYVNGVNVFSTSGEIIDPGPTYTYISGPYSVSGKIDEVRLWNTARTLTEISSNMNTCLIGNEIGLIAYYKFEDGTGSSMLSDLTINGYNGTLSSINVSTDWVAGTNICGTGGCSLQMVNTPTVTVNALPTITASSGAICSGQSYTIIASGASSYTSVPSLAGPVVTPTATTNYSITGTDANGCVSSNAAVSSVTVNTLPIISVNSAAICTGNSFTMTPTGASTYTYSSGSAVVTPTTNVSYSVTGTDVNGCISSSAAVSSVTVNALPMVSVNSGSICAGQSFTMAPSGASTYTYSSGNAIVSPTATASYSVTGTSMQGCISSNTAVSSLTVNALPMVMASTSTTLLCTGHTATLSATGATSYTWSNAATTINIAVSPTSTAVYTVTGTNANGCMNTTTIQQNVSLCTDIQTALSNQPTLISVYPNPTGGIVNVELEISSGNNVTIQILNTLGEVLVSESVNTPYSTLNIQHFTTGVYFVKVIEHDKQQVIKLIKQ